MGLLDKLFRRENPADRSDFETEGQTCAKCGKGPIPRENLALDSGAGLPIHRVCPTDETEVPDA